MRLRSKLGTGTVVCVSLPRDARKPDPQIARLALELSSKVEFGLLQEKALAS